jgi:hypothetical protein
VEEDPATFGHISRGGGPVLVVLLRPLDIAREVVGDDRGVFVLGGVGGQPSASEVRQYAKLEWYGWRMFSVFGSQGSYTQ